MRMMMMMGGLEKCFAVWDSPNRFRAAAAEEAEEEGMGGAEGGGGGTGEAVSAGKLPHSITEVLKNCGMCLALVAAIAMPLSPFSAAAAAALENRGPAVADLSVLISGPPIKDANALLRNALPITNKPIKDVQKSLEDITEDLKQPGEKALGYVERNTRQAARVLNQNKTVILADVAETKKEEGQQLIDNLNQGLQDFQNIIEQKDRAAVAPKQKELLQIVGNIEEAMVAKFPYEVPEEFANKPLLKGRATVEMKVKVKDNPNIENALLEMVVDGYNAPVTAGNFLDLVERHFYDGMEIQRADGFVVQTGDPEGPSEGFVDPSTGKVRTIPLEIMVDGDSEPIYGATLEELGRYKARTKLPFNAFGTLAMAREEFANDSASSQIFWLLKESELTPSSANILDGRYSVFGYITENPDLLADFKVGDVIESIRVTNGLDNLVNPTYKAGAA